ncbi:MAG: hypothetical protein LLG00_05190 [Planctomycetaceae bacterium]|nr:hypothetical protein [Planctomycetaceae bacterium]
MPPADAAPLTKAAAPENRQASRRLPPVRAPQRPLSAPMGSPQPTADTADERSEQMEQIAQQADRQTRHGLDLAGRGACFAARAEFIASLRLIAEGLDTEQTTNAHSRALIAATVAIKEAEDFLPGAPQLESDRGLPAVIAGHITPMLKSGADKATPMTALRSYFTFAQEQFAAAAGREVAGSMALRALGKLHEALAEKKVAAEPAAQSKAMVFYQAALLVYPANYMAANDLGVLLARCGNAAEARAILEYSISLSPQSTTWRNLMVVYRQLGQPALADHAGRWAVAMEQAQAARRKTSGNQTIRWLDPQTFADTTGSAPSSPSVAMPRSAATTGQPAVGNNATPPIARRPTMAERSQWGPPPYQR